MTGLLISGVMLFFVPDKFINLLEKAVIGRIIKIGNNNPKSDKAGNGQEPVI